MIACKPESRHPAAMRFARDRTEGLLLIALIAVTLGLAVATGLSIAALLAQFR